MTDYHVGQKVVCVNDAWNHPNWVRIPNRPFAGQIYTIRGLCSPGEDNIARILLSEIQNPIKDWDTNGVIFYEEGSFPVNRFRPLVEHKTDISIFRRLLVPGTKILETVD